MEVLLIFGTFLLDSIQDLAIQLHVIEKLQVQN